MLHLIKNKGKYDLKCSEKGRLVWQTPNQLYERKSGAYKAMRTLIRAFEKANGLQNTSLLFQDDTERVVYRITLKTIEKTELKPKKNYG